ncbi:hypothetical protein ACWGH5_39010 [Streptomyces sp. NPDC054864]
MVDAAGLGAVMAAEFVADLVDGDLAEASLVADQVCTTGQAM